MKKLLAGIAAGASILIAAETAVADGLGRGSNRDSGPRCASFHGFYFGGNAGLGYFDHNWSDRDGWANNNISTSLPLSANGTESGWTAGVQAGYNWQRGCTVFGVEADWSWASLNQSQFFTDGQAGLALDTLTVRSDINSFGTLRTRTGIVVDNLMLYATGGLAWARVESSWTVTNFVGPVNVAETFSTSDTRLGWTAGLGTEWAVAPNLSIKSEALYMKFDDNASAFNSGFALANGNPPAVRFSEDHAMWVARIGLNYRFGCGTAC